MVAGIRSRSYQYSTNAQIVSMKLIVILVIFCQTGHRNNSKFFLSLIALYFNFFTAKVDAITLPNQMYL